MRAVALSDARVQAAVDKDFVPLKVPIPPGTAEFPLTWPAMTGWRIAYALLGGKHNEGFTGCSVVSPDLSAEFGNTGSALIWEMFDSPAYDPDKFLAMLSRAKRRAEEDRRIASDPLRPAAERRRLQQRHRDNVARLVREEGEFRLPPRGFTREYAEELFRLSGDLRD
jgi:hypothetical protein